MDYEERGINSMLPAPSYKIIGEELPPTPLPIKVGKGGKWDGGKYWEFPGNWSLFSEKILKIFHNSHTTKYAKQKKKKKKKTIKTIII